jgi:hypothetical protein
MLGLSCLMPIFERLDEFIKSPNVDSVWYVILLLLYSCVKQIYILVQ